MTAPEAIAATKLYDHADSEVGGKGSRCESGADPPL
jgi:hypothetical protein